VLLFDLCVCVLRMICVDVSVIAHDKLTKIIETNHPSKIVKLVLANVCLYLVFENEVNIILKNFHQPYSFFLIHQVFRVPFPSKLKYVLLIIIFFKKTICKQNASFIQLCFTSSLKLRS
jgi:hypothetical protein